MDPSLKGAAEQVSNERRDQELGKIAISEAPIESQFETTSLAPMERFEINPNSRIKDDATLLGIKDRSRLTSYARYALNQNNIIAVIRASEQPFWLLDMREDQEFKDIQVPFLLIEPEPSLNAAPLQYYNSNARSKGIRLRQSLKFGRNHDYGNRFDYDDSVSREHFAITCESNEKISIMDLGSTNGTSIILENTLTPEPEPFTDNGNLWLYTPNLSRRNDIHTKNGRPFIRLNGRDYPVIHRDATSFNGSVDANDSRQEDIIIDGDSPIIESVYNELSRRIYSRAAALNRSFFELDWVLPKVLEIVNDVFQDTDDERVEREHAFSMFGNRHKFLVLSDYVRARSGVCRQRALLAACLLEKLQADGLRGTIHVERNAPAGGVEGHEWVTFQKSPESDIYVIDPMLNFVGKKEDSPRWNYRRRDS